MLDEEKPVIMLQKFRSLLCRPEPLCMCGLFILTFLMKEVFHIELFL